MFNFPHIIRLTAFSATALAAGVARACPTCKDSLTEQYVSAYGLSIIFMMSMPFLIFGGLAAYFYWEVRKAKAANGGESQLSASAEFARE